MTRSILLVALVLSLVPAVSRAQAGVDLRVNVGLPVAPPLVVVQPGIQVVENYDEEVFYTGGWYWVRRGPHWYRARRPGAQFALCEPRHVPPGLVRIPPGRYRHWHGAEVKEARRDMKAERHMMKAARREHGRPEVAHGAQRPYPGQGGNNQRPAPGHAPDHGHGHFN